MAGMVREGLRESDLCQRPGGLRSAGKSVPGRGKSKDKAQSRRTSQEEQEGACAVEGWGRTPSHAPGAFSSLSSL